MMPSTTVLGPTNFDDALQDVGPTVPLSRPQRTTDSIAVGLAVIFLVTTLM